MDQFNSYRLRFESHAVTLDEAKNYVAKIVDDVIAEILNCDPVILITHTRARGVIMRRDVSGFNRDIVEMKLHALEYVLNILVTHKPRVQSEECLQVKREQVEKTISMVEELYVLTMPMVWYYPQLVDELLKDNPAIPHKDEFKNLIMHAQLAYLVRGKRDVHFNDRYFHLLLQGHDETFMGLFGVSAYDVIAGILKVIASMDHFQVDAINQYFKDVRRSGLAKTMHQDRSSAYAVWEGFSNQIERLDGYDVETITGWPHQFIEVLSCKIGGPDVRGSHKYRYWPIDDLVIKDRPFVEIESKYYCFDYYTFVDNIYRALWRVIVDADKCNSGKWRDVQTEALESAVAEVFSGLLPDSRVLRNVYYQPSNKGSRTELDVVVVCSGLLIVIEAKGVALRHESPIVDFNLVRNFYEKGLKRARDQSSRFDTYFNSHDWIELKDDHGDVVLNERREDLGVLCRICVTADNINEMMASTMKLIDFGVGASGLICVSLDDLLVYERYFDSPMCFMAYLNQRLLAATRTNISAGDELDHLGVFCYNGELGELVDEHKDSTFLCIDENRHEVDDFFDWLDDPTKPRPEVYMPDRLKRVLDRIWRIDIKDKNRLACYFYSLTKVERDRVANLIEDELKGQKNGCGQRLHPIRGAKKSKCLLVNTPFATHKDRQTLRIQIFAVLKRRGDSACEILVLEFDPICELSNAYVWTLSLDEMKVEECAEVEVQMGNLKKFLVNKIQTEIKPKRNDPCPCGSGLKYKKCCGKGAC